MAHDREDAKHPVDPAGGLSDQHRWAMRLALDGYRVHEIATEMRLPVDVVETLLAEAVTHARARIR